MIDAGSADISRVPLWQLTNFFESVKQNVKKMKAADIWFYLCFTNNSVQWKALTKGYLSKCQ